MSHTSIDRTALRAALAIIVGALAVIFDTTIVSVALHPLAETFGTDIHVIQWVGTAYLLTLGAVIPLVGWLQSRFGAKRLWLLALTVFLAGSALCSFAWDAPSLIAFRVVQGLGGGIMMPLMTTIIAQSTQEEGRARLIALVSLPAALGPIFGPVIGGLILGFLSWHWLFLINLPLGLTGLIMAWRMLPADTAAPSVRLDIVGLVLLSPALVALLWSLSSLSEAGGWAQTQVQFRLVAGLLLLVGFVVWAWRRGSRALIDLSILRSRPTWAAALLMFIMGATLYGAMVLLPLFWQELGGNSALQAGLLLIPQGVGALVSRMQAASLVERLGVRRLAMLGFALAGAATLPFALAESAEVTPLLMIALLVRGYGVGLVFIPLMTVAFSGLDREQMPHASVLIRTSQQVGGATGVALFTIILTRLAEQTGTLEQAYQFTFGWSIALTACAVLVSGFLPAQGNANRH
ncbi:MDR family MFS transporter [Saccharospirillum mangrovi]|uniref:MDR family MFS transporter n=1 Tax=Saccharospirillum mangrovi TaxID=2161747 RepID=UPI000D3B9A63|nr:MDR family MFS transporter [Saccharospirillum mangrovi]